MEIAKLILIFFAWLAGLFTIGHLTCFFFRKKFRVSFLELLFRNILLGYVIVIVLQSLWDTHLKTVNIVFVGILILAWFELRKREALGEPQQQPFFKIGYVVSIIIAALLLFLSNWFTIQDTGSYLGFFTNQPDYIFYSKLSECISATGIENGFNVLSQLDPHYSDPQPYHYFDVWGASAVHAVFGINAYISLVLVIYPTFYLLCFIGYLSLFKEVNVKTFCLSLLLLFLGGLYFAVLDSNSFLSSLQNISFNLLTPTIYKLAYFYAFLLAGFILYKKHEILLALLCILCIPVANIITAPTIIPALVVTLCIVLFTGKIDKTISVRSILYIAVVSIFIVGFYALSKKHSVGEAGDEVSTSVQMLNGIFEQNSLATMRNIIIGGVLSILIIYAPFILISLVSKSFWNFKWELALFGVLVIGMSLLVYAILYIDFNSAQIFFNISIPIVNISLALIFIAIVNGYSQEKAKIARVYISVSLLVFFLVYNITGNLQKQYSLRRRSHDSTYLSGVDRLLKPNTLVASLKGTKDMTDLYGKYNAVYPLGDYLCLFNKKVYAVNIGDLSTPIDSTSYMSLARSTKAVSEGIFYRYAKRDENISLSEGELIEKFLVKFKIKYLIVSKNAEIPSSISKDVETILTDPVSGEKFVMLH